MGSLSALKQVCVIGAGTFGLISIKHIKESSELVGTVFEQTDRVGGLWHYLEDPKGKDVNGLPVESAMYNELT
jgi:cation diffusion facilitator CzcD-associated flavoprotein CzcO